MYAIFGVIMVNEDGITIQDVDSRTIVERFGRRRESSRFGSLTVVVSDKSFYWQ